MSVHERLRIGISGSYGGLNVGDEAILDAILRQLRGTLDADCIVLSRDAEDTARRHQVAEAVPVRDLSRTEAQRLVQSLDLLILGGGGILYDADAHTYLREVMLAHEVGVPVVVYAVSAGPLRDATTREHVRRALERATFVSVRDRHSQRLLEDIGLTREVYLTSDPALLLEPEPLTIDQIARSEAIDFGSRLIGFSVREPGPAAPDLVVNDYHRLLANAADFIVDRLDAEVVFFPMERRKFDVQHSHGVVAQMRHAQRATVLKRDYAPGQLVSLLGHFQFAVGMRLHFLIFSALAGLPFAALPYAAKVSSFLEDLGMHTPDLEGISAGQLIAYIDRAWDWRERLCADVRLALPELQRRARATNDLVLRVVSELPRGPRDPVRIRA